MCGDLAPELRGERPKRRRRLVELVELEPAIGVMPRFQPKVPLFAGDQAEEFRQWLDARDASLRLDEIGAAGEVDQVGVQTSSS
jgi:hypothetical protein